MKKIHRKIIKSQANYFEKIIGDIKTITKGRKLQGGKWYVFSREERREIYKYNGVTYKPYILSRRVAYLSENKKATIMRKIYAQEGNCIDNKVVRKKYGRLFRIYGSFFTVKDLICKELIKPVKDTTDKQTVHENELKILGQTIMNLPLQYTAEDYEKAVQNANTIIERKFS